MHLPFTPEPFFGVVRVYDTTLWPAQVFLLTTALLAVIIAFRPTTVSGAAVSDVIAFLWTWQALVCHVVFSSAINPLASAFAAASPLAALLFTVHAVVLRQVEFRFTRDTRSVLGLALGLFAAGMLFTSGRGADDKARTS